MNFGILRVRKHKRTHSVWGVARHHAREIPCETVKGSPTLNRSWGHASATAAQQFTRDRVAEINARGGRHKVRKNQVVALEYMITASPEAMKDRKMAAKYLTAARDWVVMRHGRANVIATYYHGDETTPHIHMMVVPVAPDGRLSAGHYVDGAEKMSRMQDEFHAEVAGRYGLDRGVKKSGAKHVPIKDFWANLTKKARAPSKLDYAKKAMGLPSPAVDAVEAQAAHAHALTRIHTRTRTRAQRVAVVEVEQKAKARELSGFEVNRDSALRVKQLEAENAQLKRQLANALNPSRHQSDIIFGAQSLDLERL